jgi:hypothetical protein
VQLDELAALGVRVIHAFGSEIVYYYDAAWGDACLGCTGFDGDRDGFCTGEPTFDCDDGRGDLWATPGEVPDLEFLNQSTLAWSEPLAPGGLTLFYDTLRATDPGGFPLDATCVESDEGSDRTANDDAPLPPGAPLSTDDHRQGDILLFAYVTSGVSQREDVPQMR